MLKHDVTLKLSTKVRFSPIFFFLTEVLLFEFSTHIELLTFVKNLTGRRSNCRFGTQPDRKGSGKFSPLIFFSLCFSVPTKRLFITMLLWFYWSLPAGLRIRIQHFCQILDPYPDPNPVPDPGVWWHQNWTKFTSRKKYLFWFKKNDNLLIHRPPFWTPKKLYGKPSALKRKHEN